MNPLQTAGNPDHVRVTQEQTTALARTLSYHSFRLPDGSEWPGLIPVEALERRLAYFRLPEDLRGLRALDIGAASGWNSFELARRGAEVTAVDYVRYPEFETLREILQLPVRYEILDMEEMTPERLGTFDIVLFFGVLYHLRHPLLGLERVCSLTRGLACIESFVTDAATPADQALAGGALLEFYETTELGGQLDNWFGPNQRALVGLCRSAGFVRVELLYREDRRAGLVAHRRWPAPSPLAPPGARLRAVINNRDGSPRFSPPRDEYLCAYFDLPGAELTPETVLAEIDGFAIPAIAVARLEGSGWQANFRLPPWLARGAHAFHLRAGDAAPSNAVPLYCHEDPPPIAAPVPAGATPVIAEIGNGLSRQPLFHGYRAEYLCCRFSLAVPAVGPAGLSLTVGGRPAPVFAVVALEDGLWQCNANLPRDLADGHHPVRLRAGDGEWSPAFAIRLERPA